MLEKYKFSNQAANQDSNQAGKYIIENLKYFKIKPLNFIGKIQIFQHDADFLNSSVLKLNF